MSTPEERVKILYSSIKYNYQRRRNAVQNQLLQLGQTRAGLMYSWKGQNVGKSQRMVLNHIFATEPATIDIMYNQVR